MADGARGRLASHAAGLRGGGRGWTLLSVAIGWLLILGMRFAVPTLLPQVKGAFELSNAGAGLAVTVIWLAYGASQLPAGMLADAFDARRLLAGSLLLSAVATVGLGVAPVFGTFLAACAGFGLGTGLYGPVRGLVLSKVFADNSGAAFGATLAAGCLGAAAMPFAAGLVVEWTGWRLVLAGIGPLFVLAAVGVWRSVPATAGDGGTDRSIRADLRTLRSGLLDRRVVVATVAVTAMLWSFQGLTAFLPTYLVEARGMGGGVAAGLYALLFVSGAGFQLTAGGAADRFGERRVLVSFGVVAALPLAVLPAASGTALLAALVAFAGLRMGVIPVSNAYIIRSVPSAVEGTAWGLVRTLFFLVSSTGSTVVGWMADRGYFDEAFLALAAVTAVSGLLYALLPGENR